MTMKAMRAARKKKPAKSARRGQIKQKILDLISFLYHHPLSRRRKNYPSVREAINGLLAGEIGFGGVVSLIETMKDLTPTADRQDCEKMERELLELAERVYRLRDSYNRNHLLEKIWLIFRGSTVEEALERLKDK